MKGLQLGELGQSIAQGAKQAIKDDTQKNLKIVGSQLGIPVKQQGNPQASQQPKMPDAFGDFGSIFEQNQTPQNAQANLPQQPPAATQKSIEEKYAPQHRDEQSAIDAARKNLQEIEAEMKKIKEEREQNWDQLNQKEEEEKKMEDFQVEEQQKQQPVQAGSANPEGGKKKG